MEVLLQTGVIILSLYLGLLVGQIAFHWMENTGEDEEQ